MMSKLSDILSDPDSAEKIKQVASSLFPDQSGTSSSELPAEGVGFDMAKISQAISGVSVQNSREVNLLRAIMPYMRQSRADKISSAIKAIQVINILSALK